MQDGFVECTSSQTDTGPGLPISIECFSELDPHVLHNVLRYDGQVGFDVPVGLPPKPRSCLVEIAALTIDPND